MMMENSFPVSNVAARREDKLHDAFLQQLSLVPGGEKIKQCIQCGTCTGSCPVSFAMDVTPRKVIGLVRAGDMETVLNGKTIWICASCYACTVRCPSGIKITDVMYALRRTAIQQGIHPKKSPVRALLTSFIDIVGKHGRNQEVGLLIRYGLKTNPLKLLSDIPFGLRLRAKGRVRFVSEKIKSLKQFSKILRNESATEKHQLARQAALQEK